MKLEQYLEQARSRTNQTLEELLPPAEGPGATLHDAMRYAIGSGGKRVRPALVLAACESCGGDSSVILPVAAAVELLHTYSLIHDDLPAMDDDDLRRGRPTVHKAFDEAVAILAGDALHTLAFEWLARFPAGDAAGARRAEAAATLARHAGHAGMVGGQIADLEAEGRAVDLDRVDWIHRHKTGALLAACAEIGAIHAGAGATQRQALAEYGAALGLAFQIADDVLDCTSTQDVLGKTPGKDEAAGKATYPAHLGIEGSRRRAQEQIERAVAALDAIELKAPRLVELAWFAATRKA